MSSITVSDKRGGLYHVIIEFSYGECERLPFNILRKIGANIEILAKSGISATAEFNIRNNREANLFLSILDMFGEDGSFIHGSAADPANVNKLSPDDEDNNSRARINKMPAANHADDDLEIETN